MNSTDYPGVFRDFSLPPRRPRPAAVPREILGKSRYPARRPPKHHRARRAIASAGANRVRYNVSVLLPNEKEDSTPLHHIHTRLSPICSRLPLLRSPRLFRVVPLSRDFSATERKTVINRAPSDSIIEAFPFFPFPPFFSFSFQETNGFLNGDSSTLFALCRTRKRVLYNTWRFSRRRTAIGIPPISLAGHFRLNNHSVSWPTSFLFHRLAFKERDPVGGP